MRTAVLANLIHHAPTWPGIPLDQWDDLDGLASITGIVAALRAAGHTADYLEASLTPPHDLVRQLQTFQPDLCFNIAEGHFGDGRESLIPAILDHLRIPYTGSSPATLALTLNKPLCKRLLLQAGLPTPAFVVFDDARQVAANALHAQPDADSPLTFPLIAKPSREGTSMGITRDSVVHDLSGLRARVADLLARYQQPVLVEEFIPGREVMVGLVGNPSQTSDIPLSVLPTLEVDFSAYPGNVHQLYTNSMKTDGATSFRYMCPARLAAHTQAALEQLAVRAFQTLGCRDMARVDFRLDARHQDRPTILEVNPLPGLTPDISDLCLQATAAGWTYAQLIEQIVRAALGRSRHDSPTPTHR